MYIYHGKPCEIIKTYNGVALIEQDGKRIAVPTRGLAEEEKKKPTRSRKKAEGTAPISD